MSAIAQRRTAAAAAIIMLFAVLQYVLFTVNPAPASADHTEAATVGNPSAECGVADPIFRKYQYNEDQNEFSSPEGTANVTITWTENTFRYTNNEADLEIYRIVLKVRNSVYVFDHGDYDQLPNPIGLRDGLSHVTFCLEDKPPTPQGEATATVVGACDDKDDYVAIVSNVANATVSVDLNGDGDFADAGESGLGNGKYLVTAGVGTSIAWEATAVGNNLFEGDLETIEGSFDVEPCGETPPGDASANVDGLCDEQDVFVAVVSGVSNATVSIDLNGDGDFADAGESGLGNGSYPVSAAVDNSVAWEATAVGNNLFAGDLDTIVGSFDVESCSEVEDRPVTVAVSGSCVTNDDGSDSGRLNVTISVANGATVTVAGQPYSVTTSGIVVDAGESYPWSAVASAGFVVQGDDEGSVAIGECEETTPTTPPTPSPPVAPEVKSALGDLVWFDENRNGQQDDATKEFPINGATVTLLAPNGTVLAQQVTGVDGLYLFDKLDAGNYRVEVCVGGAEYTTTNAPGVAKGLDSDVFPLADKAACARTGLINLPAGVTDLTWDAGLVIEVRGIQVEPTTTTAPTTTTIEPVTVGTLPFTGFEVEDMALLGIGVLAAGSMLLLLMGRREDETEREVVSGWSND